MLFHKRKPQKYDCINNLQYILFLSPLQAILKESAGSYDITLAKEISITALILQMGKLGHEGYKGCIMGT